MKFNVMDHTGHTTLEFTAEQKAEANATFDRLLAEGKIAGTRKVGQTDYQKVKSFDQLEDETTFTPARQGGEQFARSALGVIFTEDDGLSCRWSEDYNLATDQMLARFDAVMPIAGGRPPLREPRHINHITREIIEYALEFHADQIEEVKRRARANPGTQSMCELHITYQEMAQRRYNGYYNEQLGRQRDQQLRARQREDFQVREGPTVRYGHLHVQPEWHVGLYSDNPDERNAAHEKSLELLKSWLSPSQLKDYKKHSSFFVIGSDTGTQYRLISERSYNIIEFADGKPTGQKFCVVPAQSVAMGDQLLAQKIWLETDERRTLKIANRIARTGSAGRNNLAAMNMITREAIQMFQNSNAFLRNLPQYEELLGEAETTTQVDD